MDMAAKQKLPNAQGRYIAALRALLGYTLDEWAEILGVDVSTLSRIETGQIATLRPDIRLKLLRKFRIKPHALPRDGDS